MTDRPSRGLADALAYLFSGGHQAGGIVGPPRLVRYREASNRPHSIRRPAIAPVNHLAHPFEDQSRVEFEVCDLQRYTINVAQETLIDISRGGLPLPDDIVDMSLIAFLGEPRASWVRSLPDLEVSVDQDRRTYSYYLTFSSYSPGFVEFMQGGPRAREIAENVHEVRERMRADTPSVHVQQPVIPASSERRMKLNHKLRGKKNVPHSVDQSDENSVHLRLARRRARTERTPRN